MSMSIDGVEASGDVWETSEWQSQGDASRAKPQNLYPLFEGAIKEQQFQMANSRPRPLNFMLCGMGGDSSGRDVDTEWDKTKDDNDSNRSNDSGWTRHYHIEGTYQNGNAGINTGISAHKGDTKIGGEVRVDEKGNIDARISASGTW